MNSFALLIPSLRCKAQMRVASVLLLHLHLTSVHANVAITNSKGSTWNLWIVHNLATLFHSWINLMGYNLTSSSAMITRCNTRCACLTSHKKRNIAGYSPQLLIGILASPIGGESSMSFVSITTRDWLDERTVQRLQSHSSAETPKRRRLPSYTKPLNSRFSCP